MSNKLKRKLGEAFGYSHPLIAQPGTVFDYWPYLGPPGDEAYGPDHPDSYWLYPYDMTGYAPDGMYDEIDDGGEAPSSYKSALGNFQKAFRIIQGTDELRAGLEATAAEGAFDNAREVRNGTYTVSEYVNKLVEEQQEVSNEYATIIASYIDTVVVNAIAHFINRIEEGLEADIEELEEDIDAVEEDIEDLEEDVEDLEDDVVRLGLDTSS